MMKIFSVLTLVTMLALAVGCSKTNEATADNSNSTVANSDSAARPGPDNSEISTKIDANGVRTEERVFHNNPKIARVVVTTKNGTRSVKAYSPSGEEREVDSSKTEDVMAATGDKVAAAAGFVADKSEDVAGEAKDIGQTAADKTKSVGDKTVDTAKTVGSKSVEGAKVVSDKSVEGAKTVSSKAVSGAKKAGKAVKKVIP